MRCRPANGGFTLIEILVVLVIIGVALTFATLSINPSGPGDRLDTDSQRLFALAQTASDEAILSGHTIGLELSSDGYRFLRLDTAGWQPITDVDDSLRPRRLDADVHIDRLSASGQNDGREARQQAGHLMLPPSPVPPTPGQAAEQAEDAARNRNADDQPIPAALFLSSGELLPFNLELSADGVDHRFDIQGTADGEITMQRGDR